MIRRLTYATLTVRGRLRIAPVARRLIRSGSFSATRRAMMSTPPPAGYGTMIRIGLLGKGSARTPERYAGRFNSTPKSRRITSAMRSKHAPARCTRNVVKSTMVLERPCGL